MRIAIMESVVTPGGHEIDYDRILVEELTALGHEVFFYVPEGHEFKWNYGVPIEYLRGEGVSYRGVRGLRKIWYSAKREWNRQSWYRQLYQHAKDKKYDLLLFPSATYRYLRALNISQLLNSPVPVAFIIHGMTPSESARLFNQAGKVKHKPHIHIAVQTFAKEALHTSLPNIHYFNPPAYIPRDIVQREATAPPSELRLGFFGQYRKEKNLDNFLDVFVTCKFNCPIKLIIQGATASAADAADFERIIAKYGNEEKVEFWHRALIGEEWQKAIASVDAVIMPYAAERYRYHTSAMLSTAIGFSKPYIAADSLNPEVLQAYDIGCDFKLNHTESLKHSMEEFVNTFNDKFHQYRQELLRANADFSPRKLAEKIAALAQQ